MTILYSCISCPPLILCSYQSCSGQFEEVARSMIPNIPTRNDTKCTYNANSYLFHVVVSNGLIFLCAAEKEFGRIQPYGFLSEIQHRFQTSALASRAQFANDSELNRDFQQILSSQMDRFSKPDESGALGKAQAQVNEVKNIMTQNIEKVMERGERLETLITQTEDLEAHSQTFVKTARKVQRKMWWKNTKMTLCLVGVGLLAVLILVLIILFSTHVLPPNNNSGDTPTTTTTTTTLAPSS